MLLGVDDCESFCGGEYCWWCMTDKSLPSVANKGKDGFFYSSCIPFFFLSREDESGKESLSKESPPSPK